MSNAAINDASGEWYLGVYCRKCQAPVPVFRDPGRGAAVAAGTGKLTVACPRCGRKAHYAAREVISFLVYADRALPVDRAPVNDDHPARDGAPMSEGPPPSGATPAPPAQPVLELGPELAVDDEEPALELEPEPPPGDVAEAEPVLELGPELAIDDDAPVHEEPADEEPALALEPAPESAPTLAPAASEDHQTPPDTVAPAPLATAVSELPADEPAAIEPLVLEWLPIEPPTFEASAIEPPVSELTLSELTVSEPTASELPADDPVGELSIGAPDVEEPVVGEVPPAEIPVDASPDIGAVIARALAAAAADEVGPAPTESEPVAEADPFLELVAAFETAEPSASEPPAHESVEPPAVERVVEPSSAEAPIAEAPISAAPAPEPAPPAPPPVAPVAPAAVATLVAPTPVTPQPVPPKSVAQVYRERWAVAAARPQVIVELRPILRTLKARADATDYDVLARVAEQFLDYLAQVPPARQNAAAIEQYISAVFALASRGRVKGTDAVGEAMAASLRAVNRHAGLYRAA